MSKTPQEIVDEATGSVEEVESLTASVREALDRLDTLGVHSLLFVGIGVNGEAFTNAHGDMELVLTLATRFLDDIGDEDR